MRFSQRIGKRSIKSVIQIDSMDKDLKNSMWNMMEIYLFYDMLQETSDWKYSKFHSFFCDVWIDFFKEPLFNMPSSRRTMIEEMKIRYFRWEYLDVYDFIDFMVQSDLLLIDKERFIKVINVILQRELSGYRIINNLLSPITNENEISQIESAINSTDNNKLRGVNIHLNSAIEKLSDKQNPDYRNSMKESICAVESICKIIAEEPKAELGKALKIIKEKLGLHGALEKSFTALYGYTSDSAGIRHAITEESEVFQEDAIYMLVSCSAFINYLIVKANKAGIEMN